MESQLLVGGLVGVSCTQLGNHNQAHADAFVYAHVCMQETPQFAKLSNAVFDDRGNFIVYATLEGIKVRRGGPLTN